MAGKEKDATAEVMRVAHMSEADREAYFMALPPDGTSTLLVADLEAKPPCAQRDVLIKRARGYYYDDFKSIGDFMCPKMELDKDLRAAGYDDLAANVREGKYD